MSLLRAVFRPLTRPLRRLITDAVRVVILDVAPDIFKQIDVGLRLRAILASADFVYENIPLHKRFTHMELRRESLKRGPADGLVLEFGVFQGYHITNIATATTRTVYGFDSFEGLPEAWSLAPKGHFHLHGGLPAVPPNVKLIKGWFNETLPAFLAENSEPVAFVHVDCDLYSSTETVLELLTPRIHSGTTIVLDDFMCEPGWQKEEHKAFFDWTRRHQVEFEYIGYAWDPPSCAVAVQITSIAS